MLNKYFVHSHTQWVLRIISLSSFIIALIPLILKKNLLTDNIPLENTLLYEAVMSNRLENALWCSSSVCIPILLEHLLDDTFRNRRGNVYRIFRITGILAPNIIILLIKSNIAIIPYLPCIFTIQIIFYVYGMMSLLHTLSPNTWTDRTVVILSISITSVPVIQCIHSYFPINKYEVFIVTVVILLCIVIFLSWKCYQWFLFIYNKKKDDKYMDSDTYCTSIQCIELCILFFGLRIIMLPIFGIPSWHDATTTYLCARVYIDTGALLLYVIFNDRLFRKELLNAHAAMEIKRNFVNYISHEMRTPLNTVFLGLKLLQDDFILNGDPPERLDIVNDLKTSCDVTLSILNEMLTFDKLESGMLKLETSTIAAWEFITTTIKPFDVQAQHAGIDLIFEDEYITAEFMKGVTLEGDENKLGQVLRNFVSNALKFTPRGGTVTIRVSRYQKDTIENVSSKYQNRILNSSTHGTGRYSPGKQSLSVSRRSLRSIHGSMSISNPRASSPGLMRSVSKHAPDECLQDMNTSDRIGNGGGGGGGGGGGDNLPSTFQEILKIEIIDTGAGISEENQKKVFREVIQFNPGRLQKGGGSGLGLYITRGIVELHKGTVSVYSAGEGQGCTFTVELPLPLPSPTITTTMETSLNLRRITGSQRLTMFRPSDKPSSLASSDKNNASNITTTTAATANNSSSLSLSHRVIPTNTNENTNTVDNHPNYIDIDNKTPIYNCKTPIYNSTTPLIDYTTRIYNHNTSVYDNSSNDKSHNHNNSNNTNTNTENNTSNKINTANTIINTNPVIRKTSLISPYFDLSSSIFTLTRDFSRPNLIASSPVSEVANTAGGGGGYGGSGNSIGVNSNNNGNGSGKRQSIKSLRSSLNSLSIPPIHSFLMGSRENSFRFYPRSVAVSASRRSSCNSNENTTVSLTVLIVDDSLMNRKMLCRHLRKRCERLYEADDGVAAVKIVKESANMGTPVDVVLMDHQMPNMDGPTAAKAMRAMGFRGMIVGVTGNALAVDRETFLSQGADHVLTKPLDTTQLDELLNK